MPLFWLSICHLFRSVKSSVCAAILAKAMHPFYLQLLQMEIFQDWQERSLIALFSASVHVGMYVVLNGIFMNLDAIEYFKQFKIARKTNQVPSADLLRKTIMLGLMNHIFVEPVAMYFMWPLFQYFGSPSLFADLPSIPQMTISFLICLWFNEVVFYFAHSTLHVFPFLYKNIHKQHHEYTGSVGIAAEYAHPIEVVIADSFPTLGGSLFQGAHPLIWLVFLAWRLEETYESHSGYSLKLPFFYTHLGFMHADHAICHDLHHSSNNGNFGVGSFYDTIFGTQIKIHEKGGK